MINVSFVGCGGMAAHYLGVYRDLDWVRVVNCIDAVPAAAQKAAETIPGAAASTDFSAALNSEINAVIISSPNHFHLPQAVAAIQAGKHVLLQKPVAPTLADAEAIAEAAERSSRTVGLYMSYFDQPLIHDLRDMVTQMEIKPPAFADIHNPLNQHRQFLEAVRDGRPAPVPIASGVRDLRVVAALYESTRTGRAVGCG
jgi:predicted dehydrogenase